MTQEEIVKKAYEVYPEDTGRWFDLNTERRDGYIKALTEINSLPKIRGYVARDEDGTLHFFSSDCGDGEPIFDIESGTWESNPYVWVYSFELLK